MHTHQILNLMNPMEHCPACGALLVVVPGGGVCPHCGFDVEDPDELEVFAIRKPAGTSRNGSWLADDWPEEINEAA